MRGIWICQRKEMVLHESFGGVEVMALTVRREGCGVSKM